MVALHPVGATKMPPLSGGHAAAKGANFARFFPTSRGISATSEAVGGIGQIDLIEKNKRVVLKFLEMRDFTIILGQQRWRIIRPGLHRGFSKGWSPAGKRSWLEIRSRLDFQGPTWFTSFLCLRSFGGFL